LSVGYLWDRVSQTAPGWLQIKIFLISACWVDRITGVSHQTPAHQSFFCVGYFQDSVSRTICLGMAWNCDPPDLCLLRS
jgi:hypothetical protein